MALQPDLCIATKDGNPKYAVDRLTDLGIPVYTVDPRDMRGVMNSIREIGHLLGASARARELVADMQRRLDRVKSLVAHSPLRPRVFLQIGIAPIVSAGYNTFLDELISRAGGQNLAAGPVAYPRFTREQVLALLREHGIAHDAVPVPGTATDTTTLLWSRAGDKLPIARRSASLRATAPAALRLFSSSGPMG